MGRGCQFGGTAGGGGGRQTGCRGRTRGGGRLRGREGARGTGRGAEGDGLGWQGAGTRGCQVGERPQGGVREERGEGDRVVEGHSRGGDGGGWRAEGESLVVQGPILPPAGWPMSLAVGISALEVGGRGAAGGCACESGVATPTSPRFYARFSFWSFRLWGLRGERRKCFLIG